MFLAIAVEPSTSNQKQIDYRVWYLELNDSSEVIAIGVKSREEMIKNLFENYRRCGSSNWKAFLKGASSSSPIEVYDFMAQNTQENTHFGNLPLLCEFQSIIDQLEYNFLIKAA